MSNDQSKQKINQETLNFVMSELGKTIQALKSGKTPELSDTIQKLSLIFENANNKKLSQEQIQKEIDKLLKEQSRVK